MTVADFLQTVIVLHILLLFTDSLPVLPTLLSICAHLVYLTNFSSNWPYISLTSVKFLASCALVVADHFAWFFHFAAKAQEAKRHRGRYRYGSGSGRDDGLVFMDVAAFFAICVWFVPLFLFLSLSANDHALPSFGELYSCLASPADPLGPSEDRGDSSVPPTPGSTRAIDLTTPSGSAGPGTSHRELRVRTSTSLVKSLLLPLVSLLPRIRSRRRAEEGIIAPRTPVRGSPIHTPVMMPQTYSPWGDDRPPTPIYGALNPDHSNLRPRTPPPPRRVQSEAQVGKNSINPRGVATRYGQPVVSDAELLGEELDNLAQRPSQMSRSGSLNGDPQANALGPPKMSLGPSGGELLGQREILESNGPTKRKAD